MICHFDVRYIKAIVQTCITIICFAGTVRATGNNINKTIKSDDDLRHKQV